MAKDPTSKQFRDALRTKLGMAVQPESAEEAIASAWTALEEAVGAVQEGLEVIVEEANVELRAIAGETLEKTSESMAAAVEALEAVENILVEQGLIEDDDLLEPGDTPATPAADA